MTSEVTVVCAVWHGNQEQAHKMFGWIAEIGRCNANMVLLCGKKCNISALMQSAKTAFFSVTHELDTEEVECDWSSNTPGPKDASGANSLWRQASWYFNMCKPGPWFWLEPDSVPLCKDWFDVLSAEYKQAQKPFMGALVKSEVTEDCHMSGTGIYDQRTPGLMKNAYKITRDPVTGKPNEAAFDVTDAAFVLANAHLTTRIHDHFRKEPFTSMEDLNRRIRPEAVLWHSDRTFSLLPFLRQKLGLPPKGGDAPCRDQTSFQEVIQTTPTLSSGAPTFNPEAAPIVDIYLKTYPRDHELASYCLMSIRRYVHGFRKVIVESTEAMSPSFDGMFHEFVISSDKKPGYLSQQAAKLSCYKHSDAEYFLLVDSDCCFNRPVDVSEFFKDGKSKWRYTPLNLARPDQSSTWVPVMRKFLGVEPTHEFMREHPHVLPRWLMEEMEKFCRYKHGMELSDYIMAQSTGGETDLVFSEFNCAGFFAWTFHRDKFEWIPDDQATPCLVQGFTHGGQERINQDICRAKAILGVENELLDFDSAEAEPAFTTASAIAFLVEQAHKDGFAKGRILKQLKAAGLVKGGKLPKSKPKDDLDEFKDHPIIHKALSDFRDEIPKGFLLCIQSYPGGNDTLKRHAEFFRNSGASRVVVITTKGGGCHVPEGFEELEIGEDKYISGDALPKRLLGILEWFVSQPEERLVVCEYDVLLPKRIEPWDGSMLAIAGGQLPGAKTARFMHAPYFLDKDTAKRLIPQMHGIIAEGGCNGVEASPDVFISYAIDRAAVPFKEFEMFTRNTILEKEDQTKAREAFRKGLPIHGVKSKAVFDYITT